MKKGFALYLLLPIVAIFSSTDIIYGMPVNSLDHFSSHLNTDNPIFKKMYDRYASKWYKTLTFSQITEVYRNDSLIRSSSWREAAIFPYLFRIDMGDPQNGNGVIFTEDSTYNFRQGALRNSEAGTNPFTFLLGGMYAVSYDSAISKFKSQEYDLSKMYETQWQGKKTYVIGAADRKDSISKQFWVDAENLYVVRTIEMDHNRKIDAQMNDHVKLGGGWSETKVIIFVDDKMAQIEKYSDLKQDIPLDGGLFEPSMFSKMRL